MIIKRILAIAAFVCVFSQICLVASAETEITYFPEREDVATVKSQLKTECDSSLDRTVIVLELAKTTNNKVTPQSIGIWREYTPFLLEQDSVGGNVWKLGQASNRVMMVDSLSIPVVFDFEKDINTKVFKRIYVE